MTEAAWLKCIRPGVMLRFLRGKSTDRKLRLFACACCRSVWDLLSTEENRHAIEVAERFADGLASDDELATAEHKATRPVKDAAAKHISNYPGAAGKAAAALVGSDAYSRVYSAYGEQLRPDAPQQVARELGLSVEAAKDPKEAYIEAQAHEAAIQTGLLRDLIGPLAFRPLQLERCWLTWNDSTIPKLAQGIYDERAFDRMPILADTLEEASY